MWTGRQKEAEGIKREKDPDNASFENGAKSSGAREDGINCTLQGNEAPLKPPRRNKALVQKSIRKSCSQK